MGGGGVVVVVVVVGRKKQRRAKMTANCPLFLPKLTHTSPTHLHDQRHLRGQQQSLVNLHEVNRAGPNFRLYTNLTQQGRHTGFGQGPLEQLEGHVFLFGRVVAEPGVGKRAEAEQPNRSVLVLLQPLQRGRVVRGVAVCVRRCWRAAAGEEGAHDVFF